MRIVIAGASGFVGQQLVPILAQADAELLLVGRDPVQLTSLFPGIRASGYDQWAEDGQGFDLMVNLAVVNNNVSAPAEAFFDVNVDRMLYVHQQARKAGINRFINVSSIHALDKKNHSPYAASKRAGAQALRKLNQDAQTLYLPAVRGTKLAGKLAIFNGLPKPVVNLALKVLSALRPTLAVEDLAQYLLRRAANEKDPEVILTEGQGSNQFYRCMSRLVDLGFALAVTMLLWWLMLAIWIIIKFQSDGPGIFAQKRVGRDGVVFTCYKFRTMKLGPVQAATNEVAASAITPLGHFLRRTKIDELPQVWNIFRNEISLVGPRPCLPVQTALVEARRRRGVLDLKPGITGLAQVNGIDMSEPERLAKWDQKYGALQSLILDLKIIIATAIGGGQGDKVAK